MLGKLIVVAAVTALVAGCASVPMEPEAAVSKAMAFEAPAQGDAGLYIYRDSILGAALKKDVWVDGECIGETAPNVFFYHTVKGNQEHKISTESEFSPNDLVLKTDGGKNYFIRQYIKLGVIVGGAGLEAIPEEEGKKAVSKLKMAKKGTCSK